MSNPLLDLSVVMATGPCSNWPEDLVSAALAALGHPSTWATAVEACMADGWRTVSLADVRLTICRHAAQNHRKILISWMLDRSEWWLVRAGRFEADLRGVFADLRRWAAGEDVRLGDVRDRANKIYVDADAADDAYTADAAFDLARKIDAAEAT